MNEKSKAPRKSPPTPLPEMRVTHPQQRWNTHGGQQSWFKILPPDGAQEESILAINIQHSSKRELQEKNELFVHVPNKHPNTYPREFIQNTLKIHCYLRNPTKRNFISMSCSRKDRMTGQQLYEASHLYSMIAINTENVQENRHLKTSLKTKTTSHINMDSSNSRRQMVLIMQISHPI